MPDSQSVTVLLVADSRELGETIGPALTARGYSVTVADRGAKASRPPCVGHDVLLIDVTSRDGAGIEALLRAHEANARCCVIALTRAAGDPTRVEAVRAGADDALALGDDPRAAAGDLAAELDLVIARAMERRSLAQQNRSLRALVDMAASAAHDMNQPLTVLSGTTELMLMDAEPNEPTYEDMETMRRATQRLCDIVGKLSAATNDYKKRTAARAAGEPLERAAGREGGAG